MAPDPQAQTQSPDDPYKGLKPKDFLLNPNFHSISPEAKRIALSKVWPGFSDLPKDVQDNTLSQSIEYWNDQYNPPKEEKTALGKLWDTAKDVAGSIPGASTVGKIKNFLLAPPAQGKESSISVKNFGEPGGVPPEFSAPTEPDTVVKQNRSIVQQPVAQPEEGIPPSAPYSRAPLPKPITHHTKLPPEQEKEFQSWYKDISARTGVDPDPDHPLHKYDYRAAWLNGAQPDASGHMPSEFKDWDHPNRYVDGIDTITGEPYNPTSPEAIKTEQERIEKEYSAGKLKPTETPAQWTPPRWLPDPNEMLSKINQPTQMSRLKGVKAQDVEPVSPIQAAADAKNKRIQSGAPEYLPPKAELVMSQFMGNVANDLTFGAGGMLGSSPVPTQQGTGAEAAAAFAGHAVTMYPTLKIGMAAIDYVTGTILSKLPKAAVPYASKAITAYFAYDMANSAKNNVGAFKDAYDKGDYMGMANTGASAVVDTAFALLLSLGLTSEAVKFIKKVRSGEIEPPAPPAPTLEEAGVTPTIEPEQKGTTATGPFPGLERLSSRTAERSEQWKKDRAEWEEFKKNYPRATWLKLNPKFESLTEQTARETKDSSPQEILNNIDAIAKKTEQAGISADNQGVNKLEPPNPPTPLEGSGVTPTVPPAGGQDNLKKYEQRVTPDGKIELVETKVLENKNEPPPEPPESVSITDNPEIDDIIKSTLAKQQNASLEDIIKATEDARGKPLTRGQNSKVSYWYNKYVLPQRDPKKEVSLPTPPATEGLPTPPKVDSTEAAPTSEAKTFEDKFYEQPITDPEKAPPVESKERTGGTKYVMISTKPGGMGAFEVSTDELAERHKKILTDLGVTPDNPRIKALDDLGIEHRVVQPLGFGTWEGPEPNMRIEFGPDVEYNKVRQAASFLGDAFGQDAVAISHPNSEVPTFHGLIASKPDGSAFTTEEVDKVAGGSKIGFELQNDNKNLVVNKYWPGRDTFVKDTIDALGLIGLSEKDLIYYTGDSHLVERNKGHYTAAIREVRDQARAEGSPDLSERVLRQLRTSFAAGHPEAAERVAGRRASEIAEEADREILDRSRRQGQVGAVAGGDVGSGIRLPNPIGTTPGGRLVSPEGWSGLAGSVRSGLEPPQPLSADAIRARGGSGSPDLGRVKQAKINGLVNLGTVNVPDGQTQNGRDWIISSEALDYPVELPDRSVAVHDADGSYGSAFTERYASDPAIHRLMAIESRMADRVQEYLLDAFPGADFGNAYYDGHDLTTKTFATNTNGNLVFGNGGPSIIRTTPLEVLNESFRLVDKGEIHPDEAIRFTASLMVENMFHEFYHQQYRLDNANYQELLAVQRMQNRNFMKSEIDRLTKELEADGGAAIRDLGDIWEEANNKAEQIYKSLGRYSTAEYYANINPPMGVFDITAGAETGPKEKSRTLRLKEIGSLVLDGQIFNRESAFQKYKENNPDIKRSEFKNLWYDALETQARKIKGLTDAEAKRIGGDAETIYRINKSISEIPSPQTWEAMAQVGNIKKGWYARAAIAFDQLMGMINPEHHDIFVNLVAALSPRQKVKDNIIMALKFYSEWIKNGAPLDPEIIKNDIAPNVPGVGFGSRIGNVISALNGKPFTDRSFKVTSFAKNCINNLLDAAMAVTNDAWMNHMTGDKMRLGKMYGYFAMSAQSRRIARKLGWDPREVQETVWSAVKTLFDAGIKFGKTPSEFLGEVTHGNIAEYAPEFSELLTGDKDVGEALARLGVDQESLRNKIREAGGGIEPQRPEAKAAEGVDARLLKQAGKLLDPVFEKYREQETGVRAADRVNKEALEPPPGEGDDSFDVSELVSPAAIPGREKIDPEKIEEGIPDKIGKKKLPGIDDIDYKDLGKKTKDFDFRAGFINEDGDVYYVPTGFHQQGLASMLGISVKDAATHQKPLTAKYNMVRVRVTGQPYAARPGAEIYGVPNFEQMAALERMQRALKAPVLYDITDPITDTVYATGSGVGNMRRDVEEQFGVAAGAKIEDRGEEKPLEVAPEDEEKSIRQDAGSGSSLPPPPPTPPGGGGPPEEPPAPPESVIDAIIRESGRKPIGLVDKFNTWLRTGRLKEAFRGSFTGPRDMYTAEANQLRDDIMAKMPDKTDRMALMIYREFSKRPDDEIKMLLDGSSRYYKEYAEDLANDKLAPEEIDRLVDEAKDRIKRMSPVLERAMDPEFKARAQESSGMMTDFFKKKLEEGQRWGFLKSGITPEEYVTHILISDYEPIFGNDKTTNVGGGPMPRSFTFANKRKFPDILKAIVFNKRPATLDAVDAMTIYGKSHAKSLATHQFTDALEEAEVLKWAAGRSKAPEGWIPYTKDKNPLWEYHATFETKDGKTVAYHMDAYGPKKLVEALRPITNSDQLDLVKSFRTYRTYQAYLKSVQLSLSTFHIKALGLSAIANMGPLETLKAIKMDMMSPEFKEMELDAIKHGMTTDILGRTLEALNANKAGDAENMPMPGDPVKLSKWVSDSASKVTNWMTHETFGVAQRKFKVADFATQKAQWMANNPKATEAEMDFALRRIAKQINGVYGGLHWENMGWSKPAVNIFRAIFLAPDWTYSNLVAAGQALTEGGQAGAKARMFWARSFALGMALTEGMSLFSSGKNAMNTLTRVNFGRDENGRDVSSNVFFAGGPNDLVNLANNVAQFGLIQGFAQSLGSKSAPIARYLTQVVTNRDWRGNPIVPKGDGMVAGTARSIAHAVSTLGPVPFSISTPFNMMMDGQAHSPLEYATAIVLAARFSHSVPTGMREKKTGYMKGRLVNAPEAQATGLWERITGNRMEMPTTTGFKHMYLDAALDVYEHADEATQKMWKPILIQKVGTLGKYNPKTREEIRTKLQDLGIIKAPRLPEPQPEGLNPPPQ